MAKKKYFGHICKVKGCKDLASENWMCSKHAQRVRRYNDPFYVTPEERRRELSRKAQLKNWKKVKPITYRKYFGRHEHRVVMEKYLGRPLKKGEIVHHKDNNKHNNSIDNLQIMTQAEHARLHKLQEYGKI